MRFRRVMAYPVAVISFAAILGTSVPLHFDRRQFQFAEPSRPTLLEIQNAVAEVATRYKLKCVHCLSSQPYESYTGQPLFLETSYDDENGILYVGVSERQSGKATKMTEDIVSDLLERLRLISRDVLVAPYKADVATQQLRTILRAESSTWWFPFSYPCPRGSELENVFQKLDNFALVNGFTLANSWDHNGPYRTYHAGRIIGPHQHSRTTSMEMQGMCGRGGWTIELTIRQWGEDKTVNTSTIIDGLRNLLETTTGQEVRVD